MKLTDVEHAENREALASMNLLQRLDHIFEYYKFPLVLILIAAVIVTKATKAPGRDVEKLFDDSVNSRD